MSGDNMLRSMMGSRFRVAVLTLIATGGVGVGTSRAEESTKSVVFETAIDLRGDEPVLVVSLRNEGKRRVWANRRLLVEQESCHEPVGEVRLQLLDARGRELPFVCLTRTLHAKASDYGIIESHGRAEVRFDLGLCYEFVPGEMITARAHYRDATPTPPKGPPGTEALTSRLSAAPLTFKIPERKDAK